MAVPGAGGGRARNLGVGAARGRYVLLTTADARVPADWAAAMVEPLRTGRADLVAGATVGERGPVPSAAGAFPPASCGAARAVLESLGFDDALGRGRYSDTAVTAVFREDAVGAGFRVRVVPGVPVEVPDAPPGRRARAAGARAEGRTAAYLDRHVHVRPAARSRVALLAGLAAAVLRLAGLVVVRGLDAPLPARADVARECEALRLARVPDRDRPRSPAGDAPGGAGGARAAVPVALVARLSVPPTVLPVLSPEPGRDRVAPRRPGRSGEVGAPARGVAHLLWPSARGAAARRPMPPGTLPPRSAAAP